MVAYIRYRAVMYTKLQFRHKKYSCGAVLASRPPYGQALSIPYGKLWFAAISSIIFIFLIFYFVWQEKTTKDIHSPVVLDQGIPSKGDDIYQQLMATIGENHLYPIYEPNALSLLSILKSSSVHQDEVKSLEALVWERVEDTFEKNLSDGNVYDAKNLIQSLSALPKQNHYVRKLQQRYVEYTNMTIKKIYALSDEGDYNKAIQMIKLINLDQDKSYHLFYYQLLNKKYIQEVLTEANRMFAQFQQAPSTDKVLDISELVSKALAREPNSPQILNFKKKLTREITNNSTYQSLQYDKRYDEVLVKLGIVSHKPKPSKASHITDQHIAKQNKLNELKPTFTEGNDKAKMSFPENIVDNAPSLRTNEINGASNIVEPIVQEELKSDVYQYQRIQDQKINAQHVVLNDREKNVDPKVILEESDLIIDASTLEIEFYKPPIYPRMAKKSGTEGWVEVIFMIKKNGRTKNIQVIRSDPEGIFEKSAIDAIKSWRFSPVTDSGKDVLIEQKATYTLNFTNH